MYSKCHPACLRAHLPVAAPAAAPVLLLSPSGAFRRHQILVPAHLPVAPPDAAPVLLAKSPFKASRLSSSWKMSSPSLSPAGMLMRACGLPQAHLLTFSTCTTAHFAWMDDTAVMTGV